MFGVAVPLVLPENSPFRNNCGCAITLLIDGRTPSISTIPFLLVDEHLTVEYYTAKDLGSTLYCEKAAQI